MSRTHRIASLTILLVAGIATAQAECLDQSYLPVPQTNGLEVTANQPVTQTFTVGLGGQLTRVEIAQINHHRGTPTQPLQVDIVTTDPFGVPTATALASFSLPPSSVPSTRGPLQLDLSPFNIQVQQGQVLGIALSSNAAPSTQTYAWWGEAPGGSYGRGQVFIQQTVALSVWDLAFQTWVAVPASFANYGAGHPGSNGIPGLTASAAPQLGTTPQLLIGNSAGVATLGALFFGFARSNTPTPFGGTALVQFVASATVNVLPAGGQFAFGIPNNLAYCGLIIDVQGVVLDAGASQGFAFTPGLELVIGN